MTPQYQAYRRSPLTTYWIPTDECMADLEWVVRENPLYLACVRRLGMDPVADLRECVRLIRALTEDTEEDTEED